MTRNLQILADEDFVSVEVGQDRRTRRVSITEAGLAVAHAALPLWREVQAETAEAVGAGGDDLRRMLDRLADLES